MTNEFDFLCDTILHVTEVQENIEQITGNLRRRGFAHDRTKFQEPEFSAFVSTRDDFKKANYGTPEYKACVDRIKPAVDHHYQNNRHHTGYHEDGINDMSLIDIIEMICDWHAASRRSPDQSEIEGLEKALSKYGISEQLQQIIVNTYGELGWI
jgi:hypothetical protein